MHFVRVLFYFLPEKGFQMMPSFSFSFSGAAVVEQQAAAQDKQPFGHRSAVWQRSVFWQRTPVHT